MASFPLISIVVITYNSSKYVLDTLESAFNQSYKNIELIISDDCSSDDTVVIVEKWLNKYERRFVRCVLLKAVQNTGISPNCNRGIKEAQGEWVKVIAGDDILSADCIDENYKYASSSHSHIILSKMKFFSHTVENAYTLNHDHSFFDYPRSKQLKLMLRENYIGQTPTFFIRRELLEKMSYYDERFPMMEDYPMMFKLLERGYHISFMDKYTVYYRIENSITHGNDKYINPLYLESLERFYNLELFPRYVVADYGYMMHKKIYFLLCHICIRFFANRKTLMFRIISFLLYSVDIYWYVDLWNNYCSQKSTKLHLKE